MSSPSVPRQHCGLVREEPVAGGGGGGIAGRVARSTILGARPKPALLGWGFSLHLALQAEETCVLGSAPLTGVFSGCEERS